MSFSYNPAIPNPPDSPATDVGTMQSNSGAISSLIDVEHIGFNRIGGGTHKQITFFQNNTPSVPTTPPVLFTKVDSAAIPQLFFYTGNNTQGAGQYTANLNGSTMLLGGIIIKWGTKNSAQSGTVTVTYTANGLQPFPKNCWVVLAISDNSNRTLNIVGTPSTTSFSIAGSPAIGAADNFYWIAIGN